MLIYKICPRAEWEAAVKAGLYTGSAKDKADGFLHFSAEDQLMATLGKWYADADDLVLVAVDATLLGTALQWEPARDGALFPHLYALLPLCAVRSSGPIVRDPAGGFILPKL